MTDRSLLPFMHSVFKRGLPEASGKSAPEAVFEVIE